MKHFGAFLVNLRNDSGLSQEGLAPLVESSKSTLSRLENREHRQRPLQMLQLQGPAVKLEVVPLRLRTSY